MSWFALYHAIIKAPALPRPKRPVVYRQEEAYGNVDRSCLDHWVYIVRVGCRQRYPGVVLIGTRPWTSGAGAIIRRPGFILGGRPQIDCHHRPHRAQISEAVMLWGSSTHLILPDSERHNLADRPLLKRTYLPTEHHNPELPISLREVRGVEPKP